MPHDAKLKTMSKESSKNMKRADENSRRRKKNDTSDSDSIISSENSESCDEDEDGEMDSHEYRKFLSKIFPSKNLDKQIKSGERLKKIMTEKGKNRPNGNGNGREVVAQEQKERATSTSHNKKTKPVPEKNSKSSLSQTTSKKSKRRELSEDEDDSDSGDYTCDDSDTEYETDDAEEEETLKQSKNSSKLSKFNIVFTIGGLKDKTDSLYSDEEESEWDECDEDDESCEDTETEDEDKSVSTDSNSNYETASDDDSVECENPKMVTRNNKNAKNAKNAKNTKNAKNNKQAPDSSNKKQSSCDPDANPDAITDDKRVSLIKKLHGLLESNSNNDIVKKCLNVCEEEIKSEKTKTEKKSKKQKEKNARIFRKILRDKNSMNDFAFFKKLGTEEQKKIIKDLKEINKITRIEKPYRITLLESDMPTTFKSAAMKKINSLRYMESGSGEFYKIKNWVDTFMRIPFGTYNTLPITIGDGIDKCHEFMENAQTCLNNAVYGLNDAKMQIMQMMGQLITNPQAIGCAIAIHGPPGTGKTSLVKEGISKILNRPFAFIALGGATDSSFLEGHSYTYEGSMWGKIVQILIDSKCMNPVIYFDELDKISDTPKGEEIAGILTHLTDTTQNSQFHDKYFAEIDFDLSKCLFIFSYNDESKINPILKDRMYRIQTKGYNQKQKTSISTNYLLPKIREQVKFEDKDIIIPNETVHYIIDNLCNKEDGVRNLKRCLEIIYTKLNLYRLMKPNTNLFEEEMSLQVSFPFTVTKDVVDKLIKTDKDKFSALHSMYV